MTASQHMVAGSAVAVQGRGLIVTGLPGSGKSTLCLQLIDRGAALISDDAIAVREAGGRLLMAPAPNVAGLIEVRNVGLLEFPTATDIPASLVIDLSDAAPRFIDSAETRAIVGVDLPAIALERYGAALAIRAELALLRYGLAA